MAKKCVHKGCGKVYEDENEDCVYHPGPPVFHEGQKGWKCCKPRVLTFDEFMAIPPCTTGKHSEVDDTPAPEPAKTAVDVPSNTAVNLGSLEESLPAPLPRLPTAQAATPRPAASPAPPEDEDDDPSLPIPDEATCKRKGCGQKYSGDSSRSGESCVHHPGFPIFHEGSKGYSCCKRRVLEFNEFMKMEGCKTKDRHLFVGSGKKGEEKLETVRHVLAVALHMRNTRANKASLGTTTTKLGRPSSPRYSSKRSTKRRPASSSQPQQSMSTSAHQIASGTRTNIHSSQPSTQNRANTAYWGPSSSSLWQRQMVPAGRRYGQTTL